MPKRCLTLLLLLLLFLFTLGSCTRGPQRVGPAPDPPPGDPPAFVSLPAEQTIPQMIAAERDAARRGDLPMLVQLWAEDARIVDSRGTDDPADDLIWPSRAAILDRYEIAVFAAPPPALEGLPTPAVSVQGDKAQAINNKDHWAFIQRGGRWWMVELKY